MAKKVVQEALNHLIDDLKSTHGDNLACVVLYGSAAAGDHIELRSDYNLLIALKRITPQDLRLAQAPMREWQRLGHPLPVYFTVEELQDAADVFPIESMQVSTANLRHQTEYELRSKLIQLRRLYIPASMSAEKLCALMSDSLASFAALFRAVLILHGEDAPVAKPECVRATARRFRLDPEPFEKIFAFRASDYLPPTEKEANDI